MIHEGALAIKMNAKIQDIIDTIHAHPTIAEAIGKASQDVR
jgi:dihydrolipoamide dehydrogenase